MLSTDFYYYHKSKEKLPMPATNSEKDSRNQQTSLSKSRVYHIQKYGKRSKIQISPLSEARKWKRQNDKFSLEN